MDSEFSAMRKAARARYEQDLTRVRLVFPIGTKVIVSNDCGTSVPATVVGYEANMFWKLLLVTDNAGVAYTHEVVKQ